MKGNYSMRSKMKCPVCGGVPNNMFFVGLETKGKNKFAVFVIECWSGNTRVPSRYHYYEGKIRLAGLAELDQLKSLEQEIKANEIVIDRLLTELEKVKDDTE